jgi:hypothetical protein
MKGRERDRDAAREAEEERAAEEPFRGVRHWCSF